MLEWSLTYLTGLIENWDDTKHREVLGHPGEPLRKYRALVPKLEAFGLGPDAGQLAVDAGRLLEARNRVVHSVIMIETKATNEPLYEAWHARSDTIWPVDPVALNTLARDHCAVHGRGERVHPCLGGACRARRLACPMMIPCDFLVRRRSLGRPLARFPLPQPGQRRRHSCRCYEP
jgi:hypothetical protein